MTKTLMTAAALALFAGAASASLAGYPVEVDASMLSDRQELLIDNVIASGASPAEIVRQITSIVNG